MGSMPLVTPTESFAFETRGPLHQVLADAMAERPDLREIHVSRPMFLRRKCKWSMEVRLLGERGSSISLVYMKPKVCTSYTKETVASVFPCRLANVTQGTVCKGIFPEAMEGETWELGTVASHPDGWPGHSAAPAPIRSADYTVDQLDLNCESLTGFALAKAIQRSGVYRGNASITCQVTQESYSVIVTGEEDMHFWFSILTSPPSGERTAAVESTDFVSWEASVNNLTLLVSMNNVGMAYDINTLRGDKIGIGQPAKYYDLIAGINEKGEPRLCPGALLGAACSAMKPADPLDRLCDRTATLGNITSYKVQNWAIWGNKATLRGQLIGTLGVVQTSYAALIVNPSASEWLELPLDGTTDCRSRLYSYDNCSKLPPDAKQVLTEEYVPDLQNTCDNFMMFP